MKNLAIAKSPVFAAAVLVLPLCAQSVGQPIEPNAGKWKTWVITSGKDFRVPPPPDSRTTRDELAWVRLAAATDNSHLVDSVTFWSAGAPAYRWMELLNDRSTRGAPLTPYPVRVYAYVAQALYDATVATWDSKYFYNRQRPNELDPTLKTRLPTPRSPSYPSEHAAAAAAAATVLAYFFPAEAASFQSLLNRPANRSSTPAFSFGATTLPAWTSAGRLPNA